MEKEREGHEEVDERKEGKGTNTLLTHDTTLTASAVNTYLLQLGDRDRPVIVHKRPKNSIRILMNLNNIKFAEAETKVFLFRVFLFQEFLP